MLPHPPLLSPFSLSLSPPFCPSPLSLSFSSLSLSSLSLSLSLYPAFLSVLLMNWSTSSCHSISTFIQTIPNLPKVSSPKPKNPSLLVQWHDFEDQFISRTCSAPICLARAQLPGIVTQLRKGEGSVQKGEGKRERGEGDTYIPLLCHH